MITLLVNVVTVVIPPGRVRDECREAFFAELDGMTPRQQLRSTVAFARSTPARHRVLVASGQLDVPHSPVWCRLRIHHVWRTHRTDDGGRYRRCTQCGLYDDGHHDLTHNESAIADSVGVVGLVRWFY